jgi:O-acetyl-ADP-ribose deacetylase (regulator of RNase III)
MIEITTGNLLDADAEALVNTVNAVGVMGKGIALQFKQAFPDNFKAYEAACRRDEVQPGKMFVFHRNTLGNPKVIINFPTKRHWKGKARIEDIEAGLRDLVRVIEEENIRSVAVPPLGCGFGGLKWPDVKFRIERALGPLEARVLLFAPEGAPRAEEMKVRTERPRMTPTRAAVLELMRRYAVPGYRLTLLEVQKLAYFLQVAGEPLQLHFEKQKYGPYAEKLHHVLQRLEGHFIRGYGDRSRSVSVTLMPSALEESESFLQNSGETHERLDRVSQLIRGFETPYGMELLSTVHWIASVEDPR